MNQSSIQIDGHDAPLLVWPAQKESALTPIHFAHANGFPAGSYQKLLVLLSAQRTVYALDHRAAWDASPYQPHPNFKWHDAADDLIAAIEQFSPTGVIGVGHSLGACVTLLAAAKRPDLFKQLLLIEPVAFPTRLFVKFAWMPATLRVRMVGLAKRTLQRRELWNSREEFADALSGKSLFKGISREVLMDYAQYGLREVVEQNGTKFTLRFRKTWEAQVFTTPPYVWRKLKQLQVPCLVWRAEHSTTLPPASWAKWEKLRPDFPIHVLPNLGHMAPLQNPPLMVQEIQKQLLSI